MVKRLFELISDLGLSFFNWVDKLAVKIVFMERQSCVERHVKRADKYEAVIETADISKQVPHVVPRSAFELEPADILRLNAQLENSFDLIWVT